MSMTDRLIDSKAIEMDKPNKRQISQNSRREFIKKSTLGVSTLTLSSLPVFAGPFSYDKSDHLIPEDKKLSRDWIRSLYERGEPDVYKASENQLKYIGMPVGGGLLVVNCI